MQCQTVASILHEKFVTMKIIINDCNTKTKTTTKIWYEQKQRGKGNNTQNSWVVTNLSIFCIKF